MPPVVVEDGVIAFDLAESKYSVSGEYNQCRLHLWSSERNFVRRVLDAEAKATMLRLQVLRIGQNRPPLARPASARAPGHPQPHYYMVMRAVSKRSTSYPQSVFDPLSFAHLE